MLTKSTDKTGAAGLEQRIEALLGQLTLREKVALLSGVDNWRTASVERLGIPCLVMTDGPHGVRADRPEPGRLTGLTTFFPTGASMAASWNPPLIERVGIALAEETRAMGCDILLGPCVNIVRAPLAGRNFESYSEDPYLAGRIGVSFVKGVQSQKIGTSLKHYACNNHEIERNRASSNVDERTLREIYLPAFEAIVKETQPWTVMCSYNRINGVYASQNHHLLNEILKGEWGFAGFVVSDWGANHTITESLQGGLDLEMPGPPRYYGNLLAQAVYNWQIDETVIDNCVRRILGVILRSGKMDAAASLPAGAVNTVEHQQLARELAEESITLLKNAGGLLPLAAGRLKTVAVIGPNATVAVSGGGSSHIESPYRVSPLEGLKARLSGGPQIEYEQGCDNFVEPPVVKSEYLTTPDGSAHGLQGEYFNNLHLAGEPVLRRVDAQPEFRWFGRGPDEKIVMGNFSGRWTAKLCVPQSGRYSFKLTTAGVCRVYLNGALLLECVRADADRFDRVLATGTAEMELAAGQTYELRAEFAQHAGQRFAAWKLSLVRVYRPGEDQRLEHAVELARRADVALLFVGMPENYETEGTDRPHMDLPGRQNELIEAVAQANRNTIVVLNAGSPVTMPWLSKVAALLEAYYPGQENGHAVANILFGDANPSGKLSVTFPKQLADNPAFLNSTHPGAREVTYGEGVFVGYRYYDQRDVEPLFPFGFGLSYTTFEYSALKAPATAKKGEPVQVSLVVKNSGAHAGKEVVQLYVRDVVASLPRPPKELKGFQKILLEPGEAKAVSFTLDQRAFSFYDAHQKQWVAEPGEFEILVGSSSRDIRAKATIALLA